MTMYPIFTYLVLFFISTPLSPVTHKSPSYFEIADKNVNDDYLQQQKDLQITVNF